MRRKFLIATATAALLTAGPAVSQMMEGYDREAGYGGFHDNLMETGYYDAWDTNDDGMLDSDELGTGVYSEWDTDDNVGIDQEEFQTGIDDWYGDDYEADFAAWDADDSGVIETSEFRDNWNSELVDTWDTDGDEMLTESEYSTGLYDTADLDDDQYISIEEEGWFEGWFDGDDVEAEIETVGAEW